MKTIFRRNKKRPWRGLEAMEERVLFSTNTGEFCPTPNVSFTEVGDDKVIHVDPNQSLQLTVKLQEITAFETTGAFFTFQMDTSNSSSQLNITSFTIANGFIPTDGTINRGAGDHVVAGQAVIPIFGSPGQMVTLGTFSFNAPAEVGTYTFTLDAAQSGFLTEFGNGTPSFCDVTIHVELPGEEHDYGDAPDDIEIPRYPTLAANEGAVHLQNDDGLFLGEHIDYEEDGQPDADALGDDDAGDPDDEDGITFLTPLIPGQSAGVNAFVTLGLEDSAKIDAWIDFNADGDWDDDDEQIFQNELIDAEGDHILEFNVPAGAIAGATYARFRLSADGNLQPGGEVEGGEVEDYEVTIQQVDDDLLFTDGFDLGVFGEAYTVVGNAQIVDVSGNNVAQLTEGSDAAFSRQLVLSDDARDLTLDYRFTNTGDGDAISVTINGTEVFNQAGADFEGNAFVTTDPIDISDFAGETVTLEVRLDSAGAVNAQIQVDDVTVLEGDLLNIGIGDGGAKSVIFTDDDGTETTITLSGGGAASVAIAGNDLVQTQTSKGVVITGENAAIDGIVIVNSTLKSKLTFKSKDGNGLVDIGDIRVLGGGAGGSLKEINAKGGRFIGQVLVAEELTKLVGDTFLNADVRVFTSLESEAGLLPQGTNTFGFGQMTVQCVGWMDSTVQTPFGIKSWSCENVWSTNTSEITADWIGSFTVKGEAQLNITLFGVDVPAAGVLGKVSVGTIDGLTWQGTGNVGSIAANDVTGNFLFDFTGDVKSVKIKNNAGGVFDARSIQTFDVKKDLTDAAITLSMAFNAGDPKARAMKTFKVGGTADNVVVRSVSSVGKVEAARMLNSSFFVGLNNAGAGDLPGEEDFLNSAVIDSFKIKGIKGQNVGINSAFIAADSINKVDLFSAGDNAGVNYGLAAHAYPKGITYKSATAGTIKLKPEQVLDGLNVLEEELVVSLV